MTGSKVQIGPGCEVLMHFSIALADGTIADSTFDSDPIRFSIRDGTLIEGLELALYGLKPGDRQALELGPREAFGFREEGKIHQLPRSEFGPDIALEPGTIIGFTTPGGDEVPGTVLEATPEQVSVDFNHPLAGRNIIFTVEILEVRPPIQH